VTSSQTEIADDKGVKMQFVPAGEFTMGSTAADALAKCKKYNSLCDQNWFTDEEPVHRITLNAFYIDKFEVTNSHYKLCVDSGTCKTPHSVSSSSHLAYFGNAEFGDYPVIYVDWYMAKQYCEWRGARLPTEAEFEKAARGADGRTYPWGENNDNTRANYAQYPGGDVTKVGSYPNGISIFGVHDLSGNVWEWVSSLYKPYPYSATDNREDLNAIDLRVLRGGGWSNSEYSVRVTARRSNEPLGNYPDVGFRCVRDGQP
jgi:formylglycine-generating enzyme required for sulfatase activity